MARNEIEMPNAGLVLIRVVVGMIFLAEGWTRLRAGEPSLLVEGARETILAAPAPYAWIAERTVLAAPGFFGALVVWGELMGGLAFLFGALVRPAGVLLAFLLFNLYLAGPHEDRRMILVLLVCCIGCAWSRAGRLFGMDAALDDALPRWLTWVEGERPRF